MTELSFLGELLKQPKDKALKQSSSNLSLEGQSAAEFSSKPDQTHLPVSFLMILNTLVSCSGCDWLGLELNYAGVGQNLRMPA